MGKKKGGAKRSGKRTIKSVVDLSENLSAFPRILCVPKFTTKLQEVSVNLKRLGTSMGRVLLSGYGHDALVGSQAR